MERTRIYKKHVNELINLIDDFGYWSNEVKSYLSQYDYYTMTRIDIKAKAYIRETIQYA